MSNSTMRVEYCFLFFCQLFFYALASPGDNHYVYRSCLNHCQQVNCSTSSGLTEFYGRQTFFEYLLEWSCPDECAYRCMWKTVDHLQIRGDPIVQFHGKSQHFI